MYQNGKGVKQNDQTAFKWYQKAAEQENHHAQFKLGQMYDNGQGVKQNYQTAIKWYKKAADQGHKQAQNRLKEIFEEILERKKLFERKKLY